MNKEKTLLALVVAFVAGVAALDGTYERVAIPATRAPVDLPVIPSAADAPPRSGPPAGRSMFEPYSDLAMPEPVELSPLPVPAVPIAALPVRPWPILDAATGVKRHLFFEPAEKAEISDVDAAAEPAPDEAAAGGDDSSPEAAKPAADQPPPPDLADFDWIVLVGGGLGQRNYGKIELLEADRERGRTKYELLTDSTLEFTFWPVETRSGKFIGGPAPFRARTQELGFADTFENNYWSRRVRMEATAGRKNLDLPQLKELVKWSMEQAALPRYRKRECWARAAADLAEVQRRTPNDKEVLKDLGATYRLLQDFEAEAGLYEWWLGAQKISRDPEVTALLGATLEVLGLRERARACYDESLEGSPDARVRARLGNLLLASGRVEDARAAADCFRRAAQDGERLQGPLGEARAALALGDLAEAAKLLDRIATPDRGADWYDARGAVHYALGALEDARGHFQAAFERSRSGDESFAVARTNLAIVKARIAAEMPETDAQDAPNPARRAALEDAVRTAEEALRDDPINFYWPLVAKAYAQRALGEKDLAVEALQEAIAAHPIEAYGRALLGEFLLRDGRTVEARTQFQESARLSPRFPDALAGIGRCGGGEPGEAAALLRRAGELDPESPLWAILAALRSVGDEGIPLAQRLEEARRDLVAFLGRPQQRANPVGQAALGLVLYGQGNGQDALSQWNSALRNLTVMNPSSRREAALVKDLTDWVKEAIQKVSKWMGTRIWTDDFGRANGAGVGNGWREEEKNVKISLRDKMVAFGPARLGSSEIPRFWREEDQAKVLKVEATVVVAPSEGFEFDLSFFLPGAGGQPVALVGVRKTQAGDLKLLVKPDAKVNREQMVKDIGGMKWPDDGRVTFGMTKMDEATGKVRLELNGTPIEGYESVEIQSLIKSRGGKLRIEFKVEGGGGIDVNAQVEKVKVWREVQ